MSLSDTLRGMHLEEVEELEEDEVAQSNSQSSSPAFSSTSLTVSSANLLASSNSQIQQTDSNDSKADLSSIDQADDFSPHQSSILESQVISLTPIQQIHCFEQNLIYDFLLLLLGCCFQELARIEQRLGITSSSSSVPASSTSSGRQFSSPFIPPNLPATTAATPNDGFARPTASRRRSAQKQPVPDMSSPTSISSSLSSSLASSSFLAIPAFNHQPSLLSPASAAALEPSLSPRASSPFEGSSQTATQPFLSARPTLSSQHTSTQPLMPRQSESQDDGHQPKGPTRVFTGDAPSPLAESRAEASELSEALSSSPLPPPPPARSNTLRLSPNARGHTSSYSSSSSSAAKAVHQAASLSSPDESATDLLTPIHAHARQAATTATTAACAAQKRTSQQRRQDDVNADDAEAAAINEREPPQKTRQSPALPSPSPSSPSVSSLQPLIVNSSPFPVTSALVPSPARSSSPPSAARLRLVTTALSPDQHVSLSNKVHFSISFLSSEFSCSKMFLITARGASGGEAARRRHRVDRHRSAQHPLGHLRGS